MFKQFIGRVNEDTMSFLMKAEIPVQNENEVQENRQARSKNDYQESKAESKSAFGVC